jgi:hypothetical protein
MHTVYDECFIDVNANVEINLYESMIYNIKMLIK